MKRLLLLAAVVLAGGMLYAAPSVVLQGNMFVYAPGYQNGAFVLDTDDNPIITGHISNLMKVSWTAGASGAFNSTFATFTDDLGAAGVPGDPDYFNYMNMDLYKGNVILAACNNQSVRQSTIYKVDGATGTSTPIWTAASSVGMFSKLGVDPGDGTKLIPDVYIASVEGPYGRYLSDTSGDGIFQSTERKTLPNAGAQSAFTGSSLRQDAEFSQGWLYWVTRNTRSAAGWVSRLNNVDNSAVIALDKTAWPGWPGVADDWTDGPSEISIKDINANGKADIFVYAGGTADPQFSNRIGHWEDTNGDLNFTSDEFKGLVAAGSGVADIEAVVDGLGNAMLLALHANGQVNYFNIAGDGSFVAASDGGQGIVLASQGLSGVDTFNGGGSMYLKMDQAVVPEPATMLLVGTGVLGLAGVLRRRFMN